MVLGIVSFHEDHSALLNLHRELCCVVVLCPDSAVLDVDKEPVCVIGGAANAQGYAISAGGEVNAPDVEVWVNGDDLARERQGPRVVEAMDALGGAPTAGGTRRGDVVLCMAHLCLISDARVLPINGSLRHWVVQEGSVSLWD